MFIKKLSSAIALILAACLMTSCGPKYASQDEIIDYVNNGITEHVEFVENLTQKDDKAHTYKFKSTERDLEFTATADTGTITVDGAFFGYNGEKINSTDYIDQCYAYHNDEIKNLIDQNEHFEVCSTSNTFNCYKTFKFVINNSTYDWDKRYVDEFLNTLRTTVMTEEAKYHNNTPLEYKYIVLLKIDEECYQRTGGSTTSGYDDVITDINEEIDIGNRLHLTNMMLANVIPEPYDCVVIDVKE